MKNTSFLKTLSVIAAIMLLLAVPSIWPYAYFQILRWVVAIVAALNAYRAYEHNKTEWVVLMVGTAILFNPVAPIHLSKDTWVVLDIAAAILMFVAAKKLAHEK